MSPSKILKFLATGLFGLCALASAASSDDSEPYRFTQLSFGYNLDAVVSGATLAPVKGMFSQMEGTTLRLDSLTDYKKVTNFIRFNLQSYNKINGANAATFFKANTAEVIWFPQLSAVRTFGAPTLFGGIVRDYGLGLRYVDSTGTMPGPNREIGGGLNVGLNLPGFHVFNLYFHAVRALNQTDISPALSLLTISGFEALDQPFSVETLATFTRNDQVWSGYTEVGAYWKASSLKLKNLDIGARYIIVVANPSDGRGGWDTMTISYPSVVARWSL